MSILMLIAGIEYKGQLMKECVKVHELQYLNDIFLDGEIETIITTAIPKVLCDMLKSPRFLSPDIKQFIGIKPGNINLLSSGCLE